MNTKDHNSGDNCGQTSAEADKPSVLELRLENALKELEQLRKEKKELQLQFDQVISSKSWKMTEPVRQFTKARRAIFPLLRSHSTGLKLHIYRSLIAEDDGFRISGPSPAFDLELTQSSLSKGWVSFEAEVETVKGTIFFFLYLGKDGGYSEADRYLLAFDHKVRAIHPVFIPQGTDSLRLEVYDFDGEFKIINPGLKELGSLNLLLLLLNKHLMPLLKDPASLWIKFKKAVACVREGGLWALKAKILGSRITNNYNEWVSRFDSFSSEDIGKIESACRGLKHQPKISVITPVYNPPIKHFRECLDSVLAQVYQNWELCLADDGSSDSAVRETIEEYKKKDSRIKVIYREKSGHISAASNSAISVASGDYLAFLDHDDELTVDALFLVAREINLYPQAGLIYSDEDKKTSFGLRVNPHFKSDWNPELLLQQNYVCHLLVMKKDLVESVGGLRSAFDGAQDWDLILRASEKLDEKNIRHIPHVLYHWRIIQGSTAQSTSAKPYVLEAQKKAVQEHLDRTSQNAKAKIWHSISHISVDRAAPVTAPMVSLIILTRDKAELLEQCIETILDKTVYSNYEIIVVDNGSVEKETFDYFSRITSRQNIKLIRDERVFNFSSLNNMAVKAAKGEVLGFLNNDLEIISPEWLSLMLAQACRQEVGAVGARLLFPNNLLQHAGVIIGIGGVAGHNHKGRLRDDPGYFNRAILSQNLSAVTAACLIMRRDVFDAINGFDESLSVAFNDVDLCLRIRQAGYKIVYEPKAELYHHESASRGYENNTEKFRRFEKEVELMKTRWGRSLINDPYYNPNLTSLSEDFVFAFPPRVSRAWKQ